MTRLFLIRHGEPEAAWGGDAHDPGLSARGRVQAEHAAEVLAARGPLPVFTSPMQRCQETAAPLAKLWRTAPVLEPRVSEIATPAGVADRRAWLMTHFPWRAVAAPVLWPSLDPRLWAWRADVIAAVSGWNEDCVVFTHFIAINTIVGAALGRGETIVCRPDFASVTELESENGALRLVRAGAEMQEGEVR